MSRPERIDFRVVRALLQILIRWLVKQSRSLFSSYWKNVDDTSILLCDFYSISVLPEQVISLTCISFRGLPLRGTHKVRLDNLVIVNRYKLQRSFITVLNVNNKLWVIMDTI